MPLAQAHPAAPLAPVTRPAFSHSSRPFLLAPHPARPRAPRALPAPLAAMADLAPGQAEAAQGAHLHVETPLIRSNPLSAALGTDVLLKLDALQPSGSFKLRGIGLARPPRRPDAPRAREREAPLLRRRGLAVGVNRVAPRVLTRASPRASSADVFARGCPRGEAPRLVLRRGASSSLLLRSRPDRPVTQDHRAHAPPPLLPRRPCQAATPASRSPTPPAPSTPLAPWSVPPLISFAPHPRDSPCSLLACSPPSPHAAHPPFRGRPPPGRTRDHPPGRRREAHSLRRFRRGAAAAHASPADRMALPPR